MTADRREEEADGTFGVLDPKLTIYALANGMDLLKEGDARRLEWYREGSDRGILIERAGDGSVSIHAVTWKRSDPSSERRLQHHAGIASEELAASLSKFLDSALDAANEL